MLITCFVFQKKVPRTEQELLLEVRRDLGLLDNGDLPIDLSDLGRGLDVDPGDMVLCIHSPSPSNSSPLYPPGFEPIGYNDGDIDNGIVISKSTGSCSSADSNVGHGVRSSIDDDMVLADFVLKSKRQKVLGYAANEDNNDIVMPICSAKENISIMPFDGETTNQTNVSTNPRNTHEKAYSDCVEETKRTWDLGTKIGLYAENEHDVINALANLHMDKEDRTKRARVRGKKGKKKTN